MADAGSTKLSLSGWSIALVAPPLIVVTAAALFVSAFGYMANYVAVPLDFSGHAEAAARLKVLATFLLLTGIAIGVLLFALADLRAFARETVKMLLFVMAGFAAIGLVAVAKGIPEEAQRFISQPMVCYSLKHIAAPGHETRLPEKAQPPARRFLTDQPVAFKRWSGRCDASAYRLFIWLSDFQRGLLAIVTPALVFGAISCLGLRPPGTPGVRGLFAKRPEDLRGWQARRLTNYLHLSAAMLVAGLLFLSALLRWPGYSLHPDDLKAFNAQVDALVLYWGIAYSLFIASYYLPAALILEGTAEKGEAPPRPKAGGKSQDAKAAGEVRLLSPFDLLKVAVSLFAPALAGLLSGIVKL